MAIISAVNRPKGQTRDGLNAVLQYAMQDKKTVWNGEKLVTGVNCLPQFAYTEMMNTKLRYGKEDGRMYYHFVQSFPKDETISPKQAHEIACEFARRWKDFEVVVATHSDRDHVHSHFIINSVNMETGKKFHSDSESIKVQQRFNDELCLKYGFSVCEKKKESEKTSPYKQPEYHVAMRGESWKISLQLSIDNAMRYASNRHAFFELMESEGYSVKWTADRKNITYTCPNGRKCCDDKLHERKYLKEMMEVEFEYRRRHFKGIKGTSEDCYGPDEGYGTGGDGFGQELEGRYPGNRESDQNDDGSSRYTEGVGNVQRNSGSAFGSGGEPNEEGRGCRGDDAGEAFGNSVGAQNGNGRRIERDIETGWEEERRVLFSLLDDGKTDDKVHKKADMDQSHTVGGAHRVGTSTAYLAAGLTDVLDEGDGGDYGEDDIDKELRREIRSVKDGMNYS